MREIIEITRPSSLCKNRKFSYFRTFFDRILFEKHQQYRPDIFPMHFLVLHNTFLSSLYYVTIFLVVNECSKISIYCPLYALIFYNVFTLKFTNILWDFWHLPEKDPNRREFSREEFSNRFRRSIWTAGRSQKISLPFLLIFLMQFKLLRDNFCFIALLLYSLSIRIMQIFFAGNECFIASIYVDKLSKNIQALAQREGKTVKSFSAFVFCTLKFSHFFHLNSSLTLFSPRNFRFFWYLTMDQNCFLSVLNKFLFR